MALKLIVRSNNIIETNMTHDQIIVKKNLNVAMTNICYPIKLQQLILQQKKVARKRIIKLYTSWFLRNTPQVYKIYRPCLEFRYLGQN